jgi:hypothetical protein
MDGMWWRVAQVALVTAFIAPLTLVTAFCAGWWWRGLVYGWEISHYEEVTMLGVERIRRAAKMRIEQDRVGMVMTCRQVLELIERGDARVAAYEAQIARLKRRIRELEEETELAAEMIGE